MPAKHYSLATGQYLVVALLSAVTFVLPAAAETTIDAPKTAPVRAKIILGPRDGAARPIRHGQAITGGGNIDVSQPRSDTLVINMMGNVGASSSLLAAADAALDFYEDLQFLVEFSQPGQTGKLFLSASVNGVLSGQGKHAAVGIDEAAVALSCGGHPVASLAIPARSLGCNDAMAVNASQGPVSLPVVSGCYHLHQTFRMFASQRASCGCGRAIAEFSSTPLSSNWLGTSYPFQQVDKSQFGFQVTIRVVPDANGF